VGDGDGAAVIAPSPLASSIRMTKCWPKGRYVLALFALTLTPLAGLAQAPRFTLGYTSMPGRLGESQSDHGLAFRVGLDPIRGQGVSWSIEGGIDRLNEFRRTFDETCALPTGGTGTCHFDETARDTGWSVGTLLRIHPFGGEARPYLLVGVGFLWIRERRVVDATDDSGNTLANFTSDAVYGDQALQGHLGGGVEVRPPGFPVALVLEGRFTRLLYSYSGGPYWNWNPSIAAGVAFR
jgi:hypothetical protein